MRRSIIFLLFLSVFCFGSISTASANAAFTIGSLNYNVEGHSYRMDVSPYIRDGRTFMPVRYVAYSLGVAEQNVIWDEAYKTVTLLKGDRVVQVKIGSTTMLVNGVDITMDIAPEVRYGRTMLPIRYVAQAFGSTVSWDAATKTAKIWTGDEQPEDSKTVEINYRWNYNGLDYQWSIPLKENDVNEVLLFYRNKPHPMFDSLNPYEFVDAYTFDQDDDEIISIIVAHLKETASRDGLDESETVEFVLAFVQGFPYISDAASTDYDEYPRYPLETFLERRGDCEDTAILAGVLLREMGYGSALLFLPGHCSLGVLGGDRVTGSYYEYDGKKYFYTEMTESGWRIGEVPESEKDVKAIVVPLL